MTAAGYASTEELLDEMSMQGMGGNLRGIDVSEAHGGWVCVLDSDLGAILDFTPLLAATLGTAAITVLVNDSDSWCYFLYQEGEQVDAFDSSGALEGVDGLIDLESIDPEGFTARVAEWQANFPEEIREIQLRMATGQGQPEDAAKLQNWLQTEWPRMMSELTGGQDVFSELGREGATEAADEEADEPLAAEDVQERVECLRPYLPADVTDRQVRQVLEKRAVFAEELLAEFLELLGIGGFGANLSYRYAREYGDAELVHAGWPFPWQFRFANGNRPALRIFG
jgi:hypothetical protein